MNLHFLSQSKKHWVALSKGHALATWQLSSLDAAAHFERGDYTLALDYAGEALQAARYIVVEHQQRGSLDIQRYVHAASVVCAILRDGGMGQLVLPFTSKFTADCEALIKCGAPPAVVLNGLSMLVQRNDWATSRVMSSVPHTVDVGTPTPMVVH